MINEYSLYYKLITLLIIPVFLVWMPVSARALDIEQQRQMYQEAKKALHAGKITRFMEIAESIHEYPLYPYLKYNYISPRLHKVPARELQEFFHEFPDFPSTESLRSRWLKPLARNRKWQDFLDNYTPQEDKTLQCNHLVARMQTNNKTLLLEDIRSIWLAGESLPSACDPAFDLLYQSNLMTNELVWQRIDLAMRNNKTGLANYLKKFLDSYYSEWATNWINVHNNPVKYTGNPPFADIAIARQILIHGITWLARLNVDRAISHWTDLQTKYAFLPEERSNVDKVIALRAARKNHPMTTALMDRISPYHVDDDVFHWRLVTALENGDWVKLREWTEGVPASEELKYRWYYWHARALEQTGAAEKAREIYASIANKREYYGFLAADRLQVPYNMEYNPLPDSIEEKKKIINIPGIRRANELRILNERAQARREWRYAMLQMTSYQKEIAAKLATDWGWHGIAIVSLGSAHSYDDLEVRFPIPYQDLIMDYAGKRQLDPAWVYALVRSESAFIEDAKSPAGALGLMQVMPHTGKETARAMGLRKFRSSQLLTAEKNVPIGTTYLRQMLDKFGGNMILATAAYNAGPGRVRSWLPKSGCTDPDVWVERIPFNETRKYVRRIMFFASIYDWRLNNAVMPLQQRMAAVSAPEKTMIASLGCTGPEVSYN